MTEQEAAAAGDDYQPNEGAGNEAENLHERSEDVERDQAQAEQPPAEPSPLGPCPLCGLGDVFAGTVNIGEGDRDALVCRNCGGIFTDEADLRRTGENVRARSPQGWKGDTLVTQAGGSVPAPTERLVTGQAFMHPLVVEDLDGVTAVVAAIQYYEGVAAKVLRAAQAVAAAATEKAEFLRQHYDGPVKAVLEAELAGKKKRSLDVVTGMAEQPTKVGLRHRKRQLVIGEDTDTVLAWVAREQQQLVEGGKADASAELKATMVDVPEKVTPATVRLDKNALKQWWARYGIMPVGCHVEDEDDDLVIK